MAMQEYTGIEYLKIDIASNFGLSKVTWDKRLEWFAENEEAILELPEQVRLKNIKPKFKNPRLLIDAKEPALFYAGVKAYETAIAGKAVAYPISLDATASGAQILALLIGCESSAKLCNIFDTGDREDFYKNIYEFMIQKVSGNISKIKHTDVKSAVMTSLYGSKAEPKKIFGEGEMLQTFFQTMEEHAGGIWELNKALLGLWNPKALTYDWTLPDNFHVHIKVMAKQQETVQFNNTPQEVTYFVNAPVEEGRSLSANLTHSVDGMLVREILRRCNFEPSMKVRAMEACVNYQDFSVSSGSTTNLSMVGKLLAHFDKTGFLSARIIDHVTTENIAMLSPEQNEALWELLESMPKNPFKVLSIHDCFRCLAGYGNDLRRQYNQLLHEIGRSTLLADLVSQISGSEMSVTKYADISAAPLEANYSLS